MLRRGTIFFAGGMKPYHEWHLHEPLVMNYEGWRILDNPPMTRTDAFLYDFAGYVRHLDPIIDDPRLTHRQRVCRLYRWSLKELKAWLTNAHNGKFNLGYKVIRNRFEKYRYVTDPAMCDMMVRETQKYLRETCNPTYMRNDPRLPYGPANLANAMFHPDNCLVYDHWTHPEEMWYGDAKLHRYAYQHPQNSPLREMYARFGDMRQNTRLWRKPLLVAAWVCQFYLLYWGFGFFHTEGEVDPFFHEWHEHKQMNPLATFEQWERNARSKYASASYIAGDWNAVLGGVHQKLGQHIGMNRFVEQQVDLPRSNPPTNFSP